MEVALGQMLFHITMNRHIIVSIIHLKQEKLKKAIAKFSTAVNRMSNGTIRIEPEYFDTFIQTNVNPVIMTVPAMYHNTNMPDDDVKEILAKAAKAAGISKTKFV